MMIIAALMLAAAPAQAAGEQQFREAQAIRSWQPTRSRDLYEKAARQGHAGAQARLGMILFQEGNRTGALRWLKAAAEQGEPRGMLLWGTALFNGDGASANRVSGYALVAYAAKHLPEAENTRSEMELVMTSDELGAAAQVLEPGTGKTEAGVVGQASATAQPSSRNKPARQKVAAAKARKTPTPPQARPVAFATPRPAASPAPASSTSMSGDWRVQLGAFRVDGAAQRLFAQVSPRLPGKQPSYPRFGAMTGLMVGPFSSRAEAQAACRSLGSAQPCIPIKS
jgi:uncharacterized protein